MTPPTTLLASNPLRSHAIVYSDRRVGESHEDAARRVAPILDEDPIAMLRAAALHRSKLLGKTVADMHRIFADAGLCCLVNIGTTDA